MRAPAPRAARPCCGDTTEMPRRRQAAKPRRGGLGGDQEMELQIGPGPDSAFASDEARQAAYFANRDQVMDGPAGSRPWAWWEYESGLDVMKRPSNSAEQEAWLRKHGFLTAWEERELQGRRRSFEDAGAKTLAPGPGGAS
jgi:hypothetical protein